jgi:predicted aconitase with swiveling domain
MISARVLNPGSARGAIIVLEEPLSFWGGFDPASGVVIDRHHPQCGETLSGKVVLMRESRGSGTAPGAIAEAIRLGTAPAAIVLVEPDINLAIGAMTAAQLYGKHCPILAVADDDYMSLARAHHIDIKDAAITPAF